MSNPESARGELEQKTADAAAQPANSAEPGLDQGAKSIDAPAEVAPAPNAAGAAADGPAEQAAEPAVDSYSDDESSSGSDSDVEIAVKTKRDVRSVIEHNRARRMSALGGLPMPTNVSSKSDMVRKGLFGRQFAVATRGGADDDAYASDEGFEDEEQDCGSDDDGDEDGEQAARGEGEGEAARGALRHVLRSLREWDGAVGGATAYAREVGEPLWRAGSHEACAAVYRALARRFRAQHARLSGALAEVKRVPDARARARVLRVACKALERDQLAKPKRVLGGARGTGAGARFASEDDAANCRFVPRRSEQAKRAMRIADYDFGHGDGGEGEGGDVVARCHKVAREKEKKLERVRAEEAYSVRLDKKHCPLCGTAQSYKELKEHKKHCERCEERPAYVAKAATQEKRERFMRRMREDEARLRQRKQQLLRRVTAQEAGARLPRSMLQRALQDKLHQRGGSGTEAFVRRMDADHRRRRDAKVEAAGDDAGSSSELALFRRGRRTSLIAL